jgi:hypothetical protein
MFNKNLSEMKKIPVVKIEFHEYNTLILTKEEYSPYQCKGGFLEFLKDYCFCPSEIASVSHIVIDAKDFPDEEWYP